MPALLIGAGLFLGAIFLATRGGGGGVVRRSPAPPVPGTRPGGGSGQRPIQPSRPSITPVRPPSAPGVSPAMTTAIDEAQSVHDTVTAPPMPSSVGPDGVPTSHYQSRPSDSVSMTSTPPSGPRRPSPPPDSTYTHIPTHAEVERAVAASHDPELVERAAHGVIDAIRGHEPDSDVAASVTNFQNAYGQGLTADGVYGRRTRHAMSLVLGMSESALPPLPRS